MNAIQPSDAREQVSRSAAAGGEKPPHVPADANVFEVYARSATVDSGAVRDGRKARSGGAPWPAALSGRRWPRAVRSGSLGRSWAPRALAVGALAATVGVIGAAVADGPRLLEFRNDGQAPARARDGQRAAQPQRAAVDASGSADAVLPRLVEARDRARAERRRRLAADRRRAERQAAAVRRRRAARARARAAARRARAKAAPATALPAPTATPQAGPSSPPSTAAPAPTRRDRRRHPRPMLDIDIDVG
jgi:hypothetical protein